MGSHRILDVRQVSVSVFCFVMVSAVQGQDVGSFFAGLLGSSDIPVENSTFQFPPCPGECVHVFTIILCPHVIEELNCGTSYLRCCVPNDFNFGTVVETSPPLPEDAAPGTILPNYDPFPETPPTTLNSVPFIVKQPQTTESFSSVKNVMVTTPATSLIGDQEVHRPYHSNEGNVGGKPCSGICVESPFDRYCSSIISDAVCDGESRCCASSSDPHPPPAQAPPRLPVAPVSSPVSWDNHTLQNNKKHVTTISTTPSTTTTETITTIPITTMTPLDSTTIPGPPCPGTCVAPLFSLLCDAVAPEFYCPNEGRCCVSQDEETLETTTLTTTTTTEPPIPSCPGTCIPAFLSGVCNKPSELIVRTDCEASFICCYIPNVKEEDVGTFQRPSQSPARPHPSQGYYSPNPRPPQHSPPIRRPLPPPHQQHQHIPIPRPPSSSTSHLSSQHSSYSPHGHLPSSSQGYHPHSSSSSSAGHHPYPSSTSHQGHRPQLSQSSSQSHHPHLSPSSPQGHHPHISPSSSQGHHPHLSPSSSQGHHPHLSPSSSQSHHHQLSPSSSQGIPSHSLPSSSEELYPRPPSSSSSDQGYHPPSFIPISSVHKPVPPQASTIPQPLSSPARPSVPPKHHPNLITSSHGSRPHIPLPSSHPEESEESSRPVVILSPGSRPSDAEESPICPGPCIAPFLRFTCFGNNAIYNGFSCMKTGTVCCAPVADIERFEESLRIAEESSGGRPNITPTVKPAVTSRRPDPYVCGMKGSSRQETPRVMGGSTSSPGQWCWQVALINAQNQYLCGGALIGSRWVLTAAHCITSLVRNGDPIYVRVGDYDLASQYGSPGAQTHRVSTSYIHHNHNGQTLDNDIALLRLENPADLNDSVCLVCLPARGATSEPGKRCTVTGYGYEGESGPISLKIREAQLPIVADQVCSEQVNAVTEKLFILPTGSFCAGGEDGNDACQGDGGGPLVCETDGFYELMGLVSWGFGCGKQDVPGVYVKVSSFIGWINQIISVNN